MAKGKLRIKVLGLRDLERARKHADAGDVQRAAGMIRAFCWSNSTLQSEAGELWSRLSLAAINLLNVRTGDDKSVKRIIGEIWGKVYPHLVEVL